MNKCLKCQTETNNKKFCSRSCANSYNNKLHPKRKKKIKICRDCSNPTHSPRSIFCHLHTRDISSKTLAQVTTNDYGSNKYAKIRANCESVNKNLKQQSCIKCGYDKHVHLCHVKAIASFTQNTLISEINSAKNVAPLCPNCHWEHDVAKLFELKYLNEKEVFFDILMI